LPWGRQTAQLLNYQITQLPNEDWLPAGALAAYLGLQIARFPAGAAIVNAIFTQADFVEALAERAIFIAGAASLRLVADHAHEFFGHGGRLSRISRAGNTPFVLGPLVPSHVIPGLEA
jgi:hypothetical protein